MGMVDFFLNCDLPTALSLVNATDGQWCKSFHLLLNVHPHHVLLRDSGEVFLELIVDYQNHQSLSLQKDRYLFILAASISLIALFLSTAVVLSGPVFGLGPAENMIAFMLSTALSTLPPKSASIGCPSLFFFPDHAIHCKLWIF